MNKLVKQSLGYFKKNKWNVAILCVLMFLTSFMYFFVQCSIDKNLSVLKSKQSLTPQEQEFLVGLNSNCILALVFLVCLTFISAFVFYMFYKKYFELSKKDIGCFKALGFTNFQINKMYMSISFVLSIIFALVGLIVGYYFSGILLENYQISYGLTETSSGLALSSFILGVIIDSIVMSLATYMACRVFCKEETANLINEQSKELENVMVNKFAEKCSRFMMSKYSFSGRIALRKPFNIILIVISVFVFLVLVVVSVSLNLSSSEVYSSQLNKRNYAYEITFAEIETNQLERQAVECFLQQKVEVAVGKNEIGEQQLIGIDNGGTLFQLVNRTEQIVLRENAVVINRRIAEVYKLKAGDTLNILINGHVLEFTVQDVTQNGALNGIYINRTTMNQFLGYSEDSYNGIWCNELETTWNEASIKTHDEYVDELNNNNVSNRISAVIDQVLGCVFGALLIVLVILLNFQDNTQNFVSLRKLGYLQNEIKMMLINIYRPVIILAFIISIIPSIFTCKFMLRMLSLSTGDYMPFKSNIYVYVYAFIVINIIYVIVLKLFDFKLKKIFRTVDEEGDIF